MFLLCGDQMRVHGLGAGGALTPATGPVRGQRVRTTAACGARNVVEEVTW